MLTYLPKHIAICGFPGAGKTELQKILTGRFGVIPVDDGRPLRDAAISLFGLTEEQVTTPEGKNQFVEICGKHVQVRDLLGWIGELMESRFGEQFTPTQAMRCARDTYGHEGPFSYGSVRKSQARSFCQAGGVVIGVRRPGVGPSPYAFDRFDESLVDIWIDNDGDLIDLEAKLILALSRLDSKEGVTWVPVTWEPHVVKKPLSLLERLGLALVSGVILSGFGASLAFSLWHDLVHT